MTYKATQDVVKRVMPLLERLAHRSIDRARLLQYLSARAGADWGVLEIVADLATDESAAGATDRLLIFRDCATGAEHPIRYPTCLDAAIEAMVREEYKRLATDRRLSLMAEPLFRHFYAAEFCDRCRWRGAPNDQLHRECRFAGRPINFELERE